MSRYCRRVFGCDSNPHSQIIKRRRKPVERLSSFLSPHLKQLEAHTIPLQIDFNEIWRWRTARKITELFKCSFRSDAHLRLSSVTREILIRMLRTLLLGKMKCTFNIQYTSSITLRVFKIQWKLTNSDFSNWEFGIIRTILFFFCTLRPWWSHCRDQRSR
jgi:hypothetical protein